MMLLETFTQLFRDPAHWQFEFLVGGIEMLVIDLLVGALLWPRIKHHLHRDIDRVEARHGHRYNAEHADYCRVPEQHPHRPTRCKRYAIHHIDGNPSHNDLENLELHEMGERLIDCG